MTPSDEITAQRTRIRLLGQLADLAIGRESTRQEADAQYADALAGLDEQLPMLKQIVKAAAAAGAANADIAQVLNETEATVEGWIAE